MSVGNRNALEFCRNAPHPQRELVDLVVWNPDRIHFLALFEDDLTLGVGVHEDLGLTDDHALSHEVSCVIPGRSRDWVRS